MAPEYERKVALQGPMADVCCGPRQGVRTTMSSNRAPLVLHLVGDVELQALAHEVNAEIERRQVDHELRKRAAATWAEENAQELEERRTEIEERGMPLEQLQPFRFGSLGDRVPSIPESGDPMGDIDAAVEVIQASYWKLCEQAREALNPRDLGLPGGVVDLLNADFELAMKVEEIVRRGGISWSDARKSV